MIDETKMDQAQRDYNAFRADGWERVDALRFAALACNLTTTEEDELGRRN